MIFTHAGDHLLHELWIGNEGLHLRVAVDEGLQHGIALDHLVHHFGGEHVHHSCHCLRVHSSETAHSAHSAEAAHSGVAAHSAEPAEASEACA